MKVMEVKTLRNNTLVYDDRLMSQSLVTIKLSRLVENLKLVLMESDQNLHSIVLLNREEKKIVLMAMNGAVEVESFQADDSVTIQLIEGRVRFQAKKQLVVLTGGQLLNISEKTNYSITAMEEAVVMLTIAGANPKE
jgi:hypothetical protein